MKLDLLRLQCLVDELDTTPRTFFLKDASAWFLNLLRLTMQCLVCQRDLWNQLLASNLYKLSTLSSSCDAGLNMGNQPGGAQFLSSLTDLTTLNMFGTLLRGHQFEFLGQMPLLRTLDTSHTFLDQRAAAHVILFHPFFSFSVSLFPVNADAAECPLYWDGLLEMSWVCAKLEKLFWRWAECVWSWRSCSGHQSTGKTQLPFGLQVHVLVSSWDIEVYSTQSLYALQIAGMKDLATLRMNYCPVTNAGLKMILADCPSLTYVRTDGCWISALTMFKAICSKPEITFWSKSMIHSPHSTFCIPH